MADLDYDEMYKIVLVGDPGVGKTNLLAYFQADSGSQRQGADGAASTFKKARKPTVGVEFATAIVNHPNGAKIKAQIWDTAGQERYRAITSSHYRRAAGALLVYDVSDKKSFENAKNSWLVELQETADDESTLKQCTMLVGNKTDLTPVVNEAEHMASVKSLGLALSARTSAKTGDGVNSAFEALVISVYDTDKGKSGNNIVPAATVRGGGGNGNGRQQGNGRNNQPVRLQAGGQQQQQKGGCCGGNNGHGNRDNNNRNQNNRQNNRNQNNNRNNRNQNNGRNSQNQNNGRR
eukprot:CAMPEP_0114344310 /NCGR_PEP_ID=MMETSP0101-20121206/11315_1 /TAXON_ID=38822 ORGANISM="Pteridomonas danica, Strain PT" /NCGR_SAMPLE_ID=MMETSP0101 /ASSEMBLY_ACC=CAM_ASM_000211 /LENGTH=291 /DNA_ID=CAMNT_0001479577 /DNA_START=25 /DNA_END=900 /DNA_ORIENTATION=+